MSEAGLLAAAAVVAGLLALADAIRLWGTRAVPRSAEAARRLVVELFEPVRLAKVTGYRASDAERTRLSISMAFVGASLGWLGAGVGGSAMAAVAGALLGWRLTVARTSRYRRTIDRQASEAARVVATSLAAGHALRSSLEIAGRELTGPIGNELQIVANELALGESTRATLDRLRERSRSRRIDLIVAAVLLQDRMGGDLVRLLRSISSTIESAERINDELRAATAQARFTAVIVLAMPLGALALGELASPGLIGTMLSSKISVALLAVAFAMQVSGALVVKKISTIR